MEFFIFLAIALSVFSLLFTWASLTAVYRYRLISNLPVSKAQGVFIGYVELSGTCECEKPLTSYLAEAVTPHYSYTIEEEWRRIVIETETDSDGRQRQVEREESGWSTVDSDTQMVDFYVQDETGHILIHPEGAHVEAICVFNAQVGTFDPLYYGKGPGGSVADSTGYRRFYEYVLPLHGNIFVAGHSRERKDAVAPEIAANKDAPEYFLISTKDREEVNRGFSFSVWAWGLFSFFFPFLGLGIYALIAYFSRPPHEIEFPLGPAIIYSAIQAVAFFIDYLIGYVITVYNSVITLRNRVDQGWRQIDIQLKRRHDLIPNLIDTVKATRDHEAQTHESVAAMRSQMTATPPGFPGQEFAGIKAQVVALAEAYPNLKSDQNFLALQREIKETEDRIALARAYYNDIATFYNTKLQVFPDSFLCSLGALKPKPLLQIEGFEKDAVAVDFTKVAEPPKAVLPPIPQAKSALPPLPTSRGKGPPVPKMPK